VKKKGASRSQSSQRDQREEIKRIVRGSGLRATPARLTILFALSESAVPLSHHELNLQLIDSGLDKSTVFRALQDLTEAKLLRRLELGDHVWRYEMNREGANHSKDQVHPHLLCIDCGAIRCLDASEVKVNISPKIGQVVDVLIKGHCQTCLDTPASTL
jgi:Fur family ferric uptake transcriptional regulator